MTLELTVPDLYYETKWIEIYTVNAFMVIVDCFFVSKFVDIWHYVFTFVTFAINITIWIKTWISDFSVQMIHTDIWALT